MLAACSNAGRVESLTEDLHGRHVSEVLDMVHEQIRSLPKCFSSESPAAAIGGISQGGMRTVPKWARLPAGCS
jgi:hypothetical protein